MIFTVLLLYPCLLESFVKCASVEAGSHIPPPSHLRSRRSNANNVVNSSVVSDSPLASHYQNGPLATSSSSLERGKHVQTRQLDNNEWIFSSLVQPPPSSSADQQQASSQSRRGNDMPSYRSLPSKSSPSNMYTNYYRNQHIYSQTPRRVDGGSDNRPQSRRRFNEYALPSNAEESLASAGHSLEGLNRRRASSSILPQRNHVSRVNSNDSATSKMPEVQNNGRDTGTTGFSRTAPATDPTLLASERPTSTQEMQISNDESPVTGDEIELGSRGEFRRIGGRKRGREMQGVTESHRYEESAPIIFPGSSTASSDDMLGATTRPYITRPVKGADSLSGPKIDPFDARLIDGWKKLHDLRQKSLSKVDSRKSSIASDQSADAKIISILTIHGTPKCAGKDGYCTDIESYPRSFFNQVLSKTLSPEIFTDIFGETTDNTTTVTDVEFKLRHDFEDTPLCSVREHTIFPKAAQNRKGKFMYIVNHDEYLQGIRVETCTRENDGCMFTEGHLPGYSSTCKQKFIYKKLLAFTPEGKAMPDTFRLPSCCVCYVKSMFISDRINPGADVGNPDIQPTLSSDDTSWGPSSSTAGYPHNRHSDDTVSSSLPTSSSTESAMDHVGSITFPSTSNDDLSSYQVPSPTTSTSNPGGQQVNRAENQTASRRLH